MAVIRCANPQCSNPTRTFDWNELDHVRKGGRIVTPGAAGSMSVIALCPYCLFENKLWVTKLKSDDEILRGDR